jgi:hypothetical protein
MTSSEPESAIETGRRLAPLSVLLARTARILGNKVLVIPGVTEDQRWRRLGTSRSREATG